jgi:hypothetical protein
MIATTPNRTDPRPRRRYAERERPTEGFGRPAREERMVIAPRAPRPASSTNRSRPSKEADPSAVIRHMLFHMA